MEEPLDFETQTRSGRRVSVSALPLRSARGCVLNFVPSFVGGLWISFGDYWKDHRHPSVEFNVGQGFFWDVIFVENRFGGAFRDAGFAVNAGFWVDVGHFWALVKTVAGASCYASGIFTSNACFGDDMCHGLLSSELL